MKIFKLTLWLLVTRKVMLDIFSVVSVVSLTTTKSPKVKGISSVVDG